MSTTVTYNGTNYTVPQTGDSGWSTTLTTYLVALASGSLTKAGGLMTLTAELDLGATYGIKSSYFSSRGTPATAGAYRLENNTAVSWRNAGNSANVDMKLNASNLFEFESGINAYVGTNWNSSSYAFTFSNIETQNSYGNAVKIVGGGGSGGDSASNTLEVQDNLGNTDFRIRGDGQAVFSALVGTGSRLVRGSATGVISATASDIVNADINASAAIDFSKLAALTSANILVGSAANVATSVAMTGDVTISNAGVTAIGSGVIVNDDINASAAIAGSKLVAATNTVAGALTATAQNIGGVKTLYAADNLTTTYPFVIRNAAGTQLASFGAYGLFVNTSNYTLDTDITINDGLTIGDLAGTGNRLVQASSTGVLSASAVFQDSGEQNATLSWNSTAPSSPVYEKYRWYRIGNLVTLTISANYAVAGATNTLVSFTFPSGMPAPAIPTGASTTEYILPGFGYWHTNDGNLTSASSKVGLYYAAANTFQLFCVRASGSAAFATFGITYVTTGSDIP